MSRFYNAAFRCTCYDPVPHQGGDVLPGKALAEALSTALQAIGHPPSQVSCDEPFWVVHVPEESKTIEVLVYIYLPAKERRNAVWVVSIPSEESSILGFVRKAESTARIATVETVCSALTCLPQISDVRWFRELPSDPLASTRYTTHPFAQV